MMFAYDIALYFNVEDSWEKLKQIVEIDTAYLLFKYIYTYRMEKNLLSLRINKSVHMHVNSRKLLTVSFWI